MTRKGKRIALETIEDLFQLAEAMYQRGEVELSKGYLKLARKISLRVRIKIPKDLKIRYCKRCFTPLIPGKSCRVRVKKKRIIYTCLNCGKIRRYPIEKR